MISNKFESLNMSLFFGLENLTRFHLPTNLIPKHIHSIQTGRFCVWFKQSQIIFRGCFPWLQKVTITYCSIIMTAVQLFLSLLVNCLITQVHGNQITLSRFLQRPHKSLLILSLHIMFKQGYAFIEWDCDVSMMITRIKWYSITSSRCFQPRHTSEQFLSLGYLIEHNHHSSMCKSFDPMT